MSRYASSGERLTIEVDEAMVDFYAIAAAWALIRAGSREVYFRGQPGRLYPFIVVAAHAGISLVEAGREPSDFESSARILHDPRQLVVVSPKRLGKDQWRAIASQIEAEVAAAGDA